MRTPFQLPSGSFFATIVRSFVRFQTHAAAPFSSSLPRLDLFLRFQPAARISIVSTDRPTVRPQPRPEQEQPQRDRPYWLRAGGRRGRRRALAPPQSPELKTPPSRVRDCDCVSECVALRCLLPPKPVCSLDRPSADAGPTPIVVRIGWTSQARNGGRGGSGRPPAGCQFHLPKRRLGRRTPVAEIFTGEQLGGAAAVLRSLTFWAELSPERTGSRAPWTGQPRTLTPDGELGQSEALQPARPVYDATRPRGSNGKAAGWLEDFVGAGGLGCMKENVLLLPALPPEPTRRGGGQKKEEASFVRPLPLLCRI